MGEVEESLLRSIAARFGLSVQFVYKDYKLMELLGELITINSELKLPLVMKGGTALNKIYLGGLQRFSEDIDFDYEGDAKNLAGLARKIKNFSVKGPWKFRNIMRFHCIYNFRDQPDYIRLEFNTGKRLGALDKRVLKPLTSSFWGMTSIGIYSYSADDLAARKLNALKNRGEGKDIWDCYHILPKTGNIKKAVSKMLGLNAPETEVFFKELIANLEKIDYKELSKSTNQYIPLSLRPKSWQDILFTLISILERLIQK